MISPELMNQISHWRAKAVAGTLSLDEMRQAVVAMRQGRVAAAQASAATKAPKRVARSADDLLADLESL